LSAPWTLPAMAGADPRPAPLTSPPDIDARNAHFDGGLVGTSAAPARVACRARRLACSLAHPCVGYTARSPDAGLEAGDATLRAAPLELADRPAAGTPFDAFGT
jgi:hypothetical protein